MRAGPGPTPAPPPCAQRPRRRPGSKLWGLAWGLGIKGIWGLGPGPYVHRTLNAKLPRLGPGPDQVATHIEPERTRATAGQGTFQLTGNGRQGHFGRCLAPKAATSMRTTTHTYNTHTKTGTCVCRHAVPHARPRPRWWPCPGSSPAALCSCSLCPVGTPYRTPPYLVAVPLLQEGLGVSHVLACRGRPTRGAGAGAGANGARGDEGVRQQAVNQGRIANGPKNRTPGQQTAKRDAPTGQRAHAIQAAQGQGTAPAHKGGGVRWGSA